MARQQQSPAPLPAPLRTVAAPLLTAASALRKVPGAGTVGRVAEGTLDKVGIVSPRGRRIAVYTGAGVLGVAGVVEWPVALTGAAVAWLTQPRGERSETEPASGGKTTSSGSGGAEASGGTPSAGGTTTSGAASGSGSSGGTKTSGTGNSGSRPSTGTGTPTGKPSSGTKAHAGRAKSAGTASTSPTPPASSDTGGTAGSSDSTAESATSGSTARRGRTTKP
ncbi:hypothetical protein AB0M97_25835 [Streptomyces sp. NPDC051207]|uniref:hypothetical protein n=1 Tax=Streptomyces sp. NPDC051207 TaxID=3154641 RepID=UPI0034317475